MQPHQSCSLDTFLPSFLPLAKVGKLGKVQTLLQPISTGSVSATVPPAELRQASAYLLTHSLTCSSRDAPASASQQPHISAPRPWSLPRQASALLHSALEALELADPDRPIRPAEWLGVVEGRGLGD